MLKLKLAGIKTLLTTCKTGGIPQAYYNEFETHARRMERANDAQSNKDVSSRSLLPRTWLAPTFTRLKKLNKKVACFASYHARSFRGQFILMGTVVNRFISHIVVFIETSSTYR